MNTRQQLAICALVDAGFVSLAKSVADDPCEERVLHAERELDRYHPASLAEAGYKEQAKRAIGRIRAAFELPEPEPLDSESDA